MTDAQIDAWVAETRHKVMYRDTQNVDQARRDDRIDPKTATAIGLAVPPRLVTRADEVIE